MSHLCLKVVGLLRPANSTLSQSLSFPSCHLLLSFVSAFASLSLIEKMPADAHADAEPCECSKPLLPCLSGLQPSPSLFILHFLLQQTSRLA